MRASGARRSGRAGLTLTVEGVGILVQLMLLVLGIAYLVSDEDELGDNIRLASWCVLATVYLLGTVLWLNIDVRLRDRDPELLRRLAAATALRWFSTIVTFSSSLVGLTAAATLILSRGEAERFAIYELIAVWAMLAAWAMFHWGYARIYHSSYQARAAERPLRFPGTKDPRLIDFVYFSYTNGTSFAPSDVTVRTSRMRWTVLWHSTFSFFFNALIIVLSMNTIAGGFAGV